MLQPNTAIIVTPSQVEYRTPSGSSSVRVVRVQLQTLSPKISSFYEARHEHGFQQVPSGLYFDEVVWYCQDALERSGRQQRLTEVRLTLKP